MAALSRLASRARILRTALSVLAFSRLWTTWLAGLRWIRTRWPSPSLQRLIELLLRLLQTLSSVREFVRELTGDWIVIALSLLRGTGLFSSSLQSFSGLASGLGRVTGIALLESLIGLLHRFTTLIGCLPGLIRPLRWLIQINGGCAQLTGQLIEFLLQRTGLLGELTLLGLLSRLSSFGIVPLLFETLGKLLLLLSDLLGSIRKVRRIGTQRFSRLLSRLLCLLSGIGCLRELAVTRVVTRLFALLNGLPSGLRGWRVRTGSLSSLDGQLSRFGR